jgi:hypothetical protein
MSADALQQFVLMLAVLAFLWFYPWRWLRVDLFRLDILTMRDELFDFMLREGFSFDDPLYRCTVATLEGLAREIDQFTLPNLLVAIYYHTQRSRNGYARSATVSRSQEVTIKVQEIQRDLGRRIIRYLLLEGAIGVLLRALFRFSGMLIWLSRLKTSVQQIVEQMISNNEWPKKPAARTA